MSILRAGPWATSTDSFQDAPVDFLTEPPQSPVNCALNDWTGDTWKALYVKDGISGFIEAGTAALGEEISNFQVSFSGLKLKFYYQATEDFQVDFNYLAVGASDSDFDIWTWSYSTIEGASDFDTDSGAIGSGTETVTIPASTLGLVTWTLVTSAVESPTISIS